MIDALLTDIDNLLADSYKNTRSEKKLLVEKHKRARMLVPIVDEGCEAFLSYSFDKMSSDEQQPKRNVPP